MVIHSIHDLSDSRAISLLSRGLADARDVTTIKNYHPDYATDPANIFYLLKNGRYASGSGKYYIMEEAGQYVCSAGWNIYSDTGDSDIALVLTRMYVAVNHRCTYPIGLHVLPMILEEVTDYRRVWITNNLYNSHIHAWFTRNSEGKRPALFNNWPAIYEKFKPIGIRTIYYTEQQVAELIKDQT